MATYGQQRGQLEEECVSGQEQVRRMFAEVKEILEARFRVKAQYADSLEWVAKYHTMLKQLEVNFE